MLAIVVLVLVVFAGSSLDLHARYKKGDIARDQSDEDVPMIKKYLPSPSYLLVEGVNSISLKTSDSFFIEYQRPEAIRFKESFALSGKTHEKITDTIGIPRCSWKGDSLLINGYDTLPGKEPGRKPGIQETNELIIHCRNISLIELRGGSSVSLYGETSPQHFPTRLLVKDGAIYVGKNENESRDTTTPGYFDTLAIRCINSVLHISRLADIRFLRLDLDSSSVVNELDGALGGFVLQCSDSAKVNMSGKNLKKLVR